MAALFCDLQFYFLHVSHEALLPWSLSGHLNVVSGSGITTAATPLEVEAVSAFSGLTLCEAA